MEAKAEARKKQGEAEASVIEDQAVAEAKGIQAKSEATALGDQKIGLSEAKVIEAMADAEEKKGLAEATVMSEKFKIDAQGIEQKANAMKKLDGIGKEHEEFKIRLEKEKAIELASIHIQKEIAESQAKVIAEALKAAHIDIVGGETMFFDQIMNAVTKGKSVDRIVNNSKVVSDIKDAFFNTANGGDFKTKIKQFINQFGVKPEDLKNLSLSALLLKMMHEAKDDNTKNMINQLSTVSEALGIGNKTAAHVGLN